MDDTFYYRIWGFVRHTLSEKFMLSSIMFLSRNCYCMLVRCESVWCIILLRIALYMENVLSDNLMTCSNMYLSWNRYYIQLIRCESDWNIILLCANSIEMSFIFCVIWDWLPRCMRLNHNIFVVSYELALQKTVLYCIQLYVIL